MALVGVVDDNLDNDRCFIDVVDALEIEEDDDVGDFMMGLHLHERGAHRQESSHGPWHWNARLSSELQQVVDTFCGIGELCDLDFSVTVADPRQLDCPLVACSAGFTKLTGYGVQEIVGRNCRFLLNGVPNELVDEETRFKCRAFCASSAQGSDYNGTPELAHDAPWKTWTELPRGEIICVQTNAKKTGELFRNMFYMKQVELDDAPYILGLQAGLPEDFDEASFKELERVCHAAFGLLSEHMTVIEQMFAQRFWYSAHMRRQI